VSSKNRLVKRKINFAKEPKIDFPDWNKTKFGVHDARAKRPVSMVSQIEFARSNPHHSSRRKTTIAFYGELAGKHKRPSTSQQKRMDSD